jgi:hypothetical protein
MSPETAAARLAAARTTPDRTPADRDLIGRGYRSAPLTQRLGCFSARLNAAQALCGNASRKPGWLYDAQRDELRRSLPDQREYDAIQAGIADGYIDATKLVEYFAEKFLIHAATLATRDGATDVTFVATVREAAEALEYVSVARGLPTKENKQLAAREGVQGALVMLAHATELHRAGAA